MRRFLYSLTIVGVLIASRLDGALISITDNGPTAFGADSVTWDTEAGLEWLDLTFSINMSYDSVNSQLGSGDTFDGWTIPTGSEVSTLFSNAGITNVIDGGFIPQATTGPAEALIALVGNTSAPLAEQADGNYDDGGGIFIGRARVFVAGPGDAVSRIDTDWYDRTSPREFTGAWLVRDAPRPIPEPTTILLLGVATLGLGCRLRRRKSQ